MRCRHSSTIGQHLFTLGTGRQRGVVMEGCQIAFPTGGRAAEEYLILSAQLMFVGGICHAPESENECFESVPV